MIVLQMPCASAGRRVAFMLVVVWSASLSGCGPDPGPPRFHVSGEVTFDDEPIPYGEIIFEPDSSENNTGPATRATIENGAYTTKKGKGTVGGPMLVRISGFDGKPEAGGGTQPHGKPLFKEHQEQIDLPKAESTESFNVPKK